MLSVFLALRLSPHSFSLWDLSSEFLARSLLLLALTMNTNWPTLFLRFGNVARSALRFLGNVFGHRRFPLSIFICVDAAAKLRPNQTVLLGLCAPLVVENDEVNASPLMSLVGFSHKRSVRNPILQQFRSSIAVAQVKPLPISDHGATCLPSNG